MLKSSSTNSLNIMLIIIFVACLASGGIFVRMSELGPINTGLWRIIFSIPILLPFIVAEKNKIDHRKLEKKDIVVLLVAGGFLAGDLSVWNISFHYTTTAMLICWRISSL